MVREIQTVVRVKIEINGGQIEKFNWKDVRNYNDGNNHRRGHDGIIILVVEPRDINTRKLRSFRTIYLRELTREKNVKYGFIYRRVLVVRA